MKTLKFYFVILIVFLSLEMKVVAQSYDSLDINNVVCPFYPDGYLFTYFTSAGFEVPKGSNLHTIFAGSMWIGGIDNGGLLHQAALTYRQTGSDFFPGPGKDSADNSLSLYNQWNNVWKINKTTIDSFKAWFQNPSSFPNYVIPNVISNWPANPNYSIGEGPCLAPYFDYNGDGGYNPLDGDYPLIKGDQAIFFIFNDNDSVHTEAGGAKMNIEVHGMAYAFNNPNDSIIDNTIFLNYQIYNLSHNTYNSTYIGNWTDMDIGYYLDDYIGCDVSRSAYFGYNGEPVDQDYGTNPPAQGVVFLKGPPINPQDTFFNFRDSVIGNPLGTIPMTNFMFYDNTGEVNGNPDAAMQYYNYLRSIWRDALHATFGATGCDSTGGVPYNYMFPGNSDPYGWGWNGDTLPYNWTEDQAGLQPNDIRGVGSSGPFTFYPGQVICIDYAYIFARTTQGGPLASVALLDTAIDHIRSFYMNDSTLQVCNCYNYSLGIPSISNQQPSWVKVYPNPFDQETNISINSPLIKQGNKLTLKIYDLLGTQVKEVDNINVSLVTLDRGSLAAGMYFYKLFNDNETLATGKLVIE